MAISDITSLPERSSSRAWHLLDLARSNSAGDYLNDVLVPVSALILLRWAEQREEEAEAIAAFENRPFQRLFAEDFSWSACVELPRWELPRFLTLLFLDLRNPLEAPFDKEIVSHFCRLEGVFDPEKIDVDLLRAALSWVSEYSLETTYDRERLADAFEKLIDAALTLTRYRGEFFTPADLVELMVEVANPQPGERIYDPCFGTGGLLAAAGRRIVRAGQTLSPASWADIQQRTLYGVEIQPSLLLIGLVRMILAGIDSPRLECGNTLERDIKLNRSAEGFDCILAHPPFGVKISRENAHFPIRATTVETLFLQHTMASLRPGGRAVIVVPEGVLFRSGADARVREKLLTEFCVEGVLSLPAGVFLPYTGVKTSLLVFRKAEPSDDIWFQEVQRQEKRKGKKSVTFDALEEANLFRSREKSPHAWLTSKPELETHGYELIVKWTGAEELERFLQELRSHSPETRVVGIDEIAEAFPGVSYGQAGTTPEASSPLVTARVEQAKFFEEPGGQQSLQVPHVGLLRVSDINKGEVKAPSLFLNADGLRRVTEKHRLRVNDVLVAAAGTVGKVALVREGLARTVPAKSLIVIRVKKDIQPRFLLRLLQSGPYQDWLAGHASGTVSRNLSASVLCRLRIPIPPVEIQQQIGANLPADADAGVMLKAFATGQTASQIESFLLSDPTIQDLLTKGEPADDRESIRRIGSLALALAPWGERADRGEVGDEDLAEWLMLAMRISLDLSEAFTLPKGAERLAFLERLRYDCKGLQLFFPQSSSVSQRVEAISEAIGHVVDAGRRQLLEQVEVSGRVEPPNTDSAKSSEITIRLRNDGELLLRSLSVKTQPEQSEADFPLFSKGEEVSWPLTVSPRPAGTYPLTVKWEAFRFDGEVVSGEISLAYEVRSLRAVSKGEALGSNPYSAGPPVDRPEMFFGRRTLLDKIRRQLNVEHRANVILLEGNRRTGKSSILKYLERPGELPGWVPAYCQFQSGEGDARAIGLPTREVFYLIAKAVALAVHKDEHPIEFPHLGIVEEGRFFLFHLGKMLDRYFVGDRPFELLEVLVTSWLEIVRPKRILLMLDEFDKLQEGIDNGLTSPQVPENLRYLFHAYSGLSGILTGSRRLKRLREEYWSALFGLGYRVGLDPLEVEEARALVTEPVRDRLVYVPGARDHVATLCAYQPFLIQSLCNRIFEYCAGSGERTVTTHLVEAAADEMITDNEHFHTLWDYMENDRCRFLFCLIDRYSAGPDRVSVEFLESKFDEYGIIRGRRESIGDALDFLRELEVIELEQSALLPTYRISIPLMARWLKENKDLEEVRRRAVREGEEGTI